MERHNDLQRVLCRLQRDIPQFLLNYWYLDDGSMIGIKSDQKAVDIFHKEGESQGFSPPEKSLVWSEQYDDDNTDPLQ